MVTLEHDTAKVLVFGDSVVGQALELLLGGSPDFDVRYSVDPSLDNLDLLDGIGLVLLAPVVRIELRASLLRLIENRPPDRRIPILELVSDGEATRDGVDHALLWPCPTEDLKRWINDALLFGYPASHDG